MKTAFLLLALLSTSLIFSQSLSHKSDGSAWTKKSYDYYNGDCMITANKYKELLQDNEQALSNFNSHLRSKFYADLINGLSGVLATFNLINWISGDDFSWELVGANLALTIPSYFLNKKAEKMLNKVEEKFNNEVSFKFVGDQFGLGVAVRF